MKCRRKYILILIFVLFELITGGGLLIITSPYYKSFNHEISDEVDDDIRVSIGLEFRQRVYNIPLIATISRWDEPGGIVANFYPKRQDGPQDDFYNVIESVQLSEFAIIDDLGNRFVHPVQFECIFEIDFPRMDVKSFKLHECVGSHRDYEIQLRGQAKYSDGSKQDFIVKESFKFEKSLLDRRSFLIGVRWYLRGR